MTVFYSVFLYSELEKSGERKEGKEVATTTDTDIKTKGKPSCYRADFFSVVFVRCQFLWQLESK